MGAEIQETSVRFSGPGKRKVPLGFRVHIASRTESRVDGVPSMWRRRRAVTGSAVAVKALRVSGFCRNRIGQ